MTSGIYSIVSPSGDLYIGSSSNLEKRWKQHKYHLNRDDHHNYRLKSAWKEFQDNLEFNILLICESKDLILYEQQYLDFYKPLLNISKNANRTFNALGIKRTEETRLKISFALKGKNKKGRPQTEETKTKLSLLRKGSNNPMFGKTPWNKKEVHV